MIDTATATAEPTMDTTEPSSLRSIIKELPPRTEQCHEDNRLTDPHHLSLIHEDPQPPTKHSEQLPKKKPPKASRKRKAPPGGSSGRWTDDEHGAFLRGLSLYGREWKRVAAEIPTRTSAQVRSHAQKYFAKLSKFDTTAAADWEGPTSDATIIPSPETIQMSPSVRRQAERILADPASVEAEVRETLHQLKLKYAELQQRLNRQSTDDELIALDVLRGGLTGP